MKIQEAKKKKKKLCGLLHLTFFFLSLLYSFLFFFTLNQFNFGNRKMKGKRGKVASFSYLCGYGIIQVRVFCKSEKKNKDPKAALKVYSKTSSSWVPIFLYIPSITSQTWTWQVYFLVDHVILNVSRKANVWSQLYTYNWLSSLKITIFRHN